MTWIMDAIRGAGRVPAYMLITALVFAEDALFVGFILPGETAAIVGGVLASQHHLQLWLIMILVVLAAIIGDSVGYEIGRHFGPRIMNLPVLETRRGKLDSARAFLARRGGVAVFLGRFTAFFRAVMPALAGLSHMPYRRFLTFNAVGGAVWAPQRSCWVTSPATPTSPSRKPSAATSHWPSLPLRRSSSSCGGSENTDVT